MPEGLEERALLSVGLDPTWGFGGVAEWNVPPSNATTSYLQSFDAIALQNGQVVEVGTATSTPTAGGSASTTNLIVGRLTTAGQPDSTFGTGGLVTIPLTFGGAGYSSPEAEDIAVQANGSIDILATVTPTASGTTSDDDLVVQLTPGGSLDTTFGAGGGELFNLGSGDAIEGGESAMLAIGPDGRIVVAGTAISSSTSTDVFAVARLNTNGTLDTSFNGTGYTTVAFNTGGTSSTDDIAGAVVVQSNSAIVVAGSAALPTTGSGTLSSTPSDVAVARLGANGALDTSFNGNGTLTYNFDLGGSSSSDSASALALSGTQIVIAGTSQQVFPTTPGTFTPSNDELTVTRLDANGSFDTTFASGGKFLLPLTQAGVTFNTSATSVIARPSGSLLVGGAAREQNAAYYSGPSAGLLLSLTPTGAPDTTFAPSGVALIPESVDSRILQQTDGKVIFLAGNEVVRTTAPAPAVASSAIVTTGTGKKARATGVTITFNTAVNPSLLTNPGIYQVRTVKGRRLVKLRKRGGVSYDASTQTLTLTFASKVAIGSGFSLVVTTDGIIGMDGQVLSSTPIVITPTTT